MPRVRKGAARAQARKRMLRKTRGYYGSARNHPQRAFEAVMRAERFAWRDRRQRKRDMRRLWITRITAACRMRDTRYSLFMNGLRLAGITINRKMLSQIAIDDPKAFDEMVSIAVKSSRATPAAAA